MTAVDFFVFQEPASKQRFDAERRQKVGGHAKALDRFRFVAADEIGIPPPEPREPIEHLLLRGQIDEVGIRHGASSVGVVLQRVGQQMMRSMCASWDAGPRRRRKTGVRAEAERVTTMTR